MTKRFRLDISLSTVLTVAEIWPDGNAPVDPTPKDVDEAFRKSGINVLMSASAWNLEDEADVVITEEQGD